MATFSTTLESSWALPDLFNYVATLSNAPEWDPAITSGEALSTGNPRLHSSYRLMLAIGRRELPLLYEIVEFDRLRRAVLSASSKMVQSLVEIEVTPAPIGTRLTYSVSVAASGPLAAADPLIGRLVKRNAAKAEAGLRAKFAAPITSNAASQAG